MAARKTGVVHAGYLKTRVIRGANDGGARIVRAATATTTTVAVAVAAAHVVAVVMVLVIVDVATVMRTYPATSRRRMAVAVVREIISGMG